MPKEKKYECYTCGLTGEREVFTGEFGSWLKCPSCGVYNVYRAKDDPIWQRDQLITGGGPHEHAIRVFAEFHNSTRSYRGERRGGNYRVFSYATCIYEFANGVHYVNDTSYSVTTSKQQWDVTRALREVGEDQQVHVVHVPRGARSLVDYNTGRVGQLRAARIAKAGAR